MTEGEDLERPEVEAIEVAALALGLGDQAERVGEEAR